MSSLPDSALTAQRPGAPAEFDRPLQLTPSQDLRGYIFSRAGRLALLGITCASVLAVVMIFVFIIGKAVPFLTSPHVVEFFTSSKWYPADPEPIFGALSLIYGSFLVTIVAIALAVPVALLAAVFLSDIASFRFRQLAKPVIEILAAIPSVAYGFFALLVLAPWLQENWDLPTGANALNASLVLAVMAIPTIVSIAEDALSAVGRELREGAYALGATRAEVLIKVVIPAAHSGIIAAIILGIMRAIGETMLVLMAAGMAAQIPGPFWNLTEPVRTVTATIAQEMGETAHGTLHYHALFALGLVLLVITFALNLISEHLLKRSRRAQGGKR
ncbi:MAG: phosphate ABC transporter permease subunit PstC [Planctomycetota bacterium]